MTVKLVGSFPATTPTTVWAVVAPLPLMCRANVIAWALRSDGSVAPIASLMGRDPHVIESVWHEDPEEVRDRWIDSLLTLPMLPPGSTVPDVPIAWAAPGSLVVGSVGLGNAVWGPYVAYEEQIGAGIDVLPTFEPVKSTSDYQEQLLIGQAATCRITWTDQTDLDDGTPASIVLIEPTGVTT